MNICSFEKKKKKSVTGTNETHLRQKSKASAKGNSIKTETVQGGPAVRSGFAHCFH